MSPVILYIISIILFSRVNVEQHNAETYPQTNKSAVTAWSKREQRSTCAACSNGRSIARFHAPREPLNVAAVGSEAPNDGFLDSSGIMGRRAGETAAGDETAAGEPAKLSPWDVALRRKTLVDIEMRGFEVLRGVSWEGCRFGEKAWSGASIWDLNSRILLAAASINCENKLQESITLQEGGTTRVTYLHQQRLGRQRTCGSCIASYIHTTINSLPFLRRIFLIVLLSGIEV